MNRGSCFISYCHEDCDRKSLNFLKDLLKESSHDAFSILFDWDLDYGDDLNKFMEHLRTTDAVVLLLSPAYKRKVLARQGGSYREYAQIVARHQELTQRKRAGQKLADIPGYFELIPVLWSGDSAASLLPELAHLKYLDLTSFRVIENDKGEPIITDQLKRTALPELGRVVDRIRFVISLKGRSFQALYDEQFKKLFLELKADWDNPRDERHNYLDSLFVRTTAYKRVESQEVYFIVGRKGSGKSTVVDAMAIRHCERYKGHIAVVADDFDLESLYETLNLQQLRSDTKSFFKRIKCFQFAWEAFLYLSAMDLLVDLDDRGLLSEHQTPQMAPIRALVKHVLSHGNGKTVTAGAARSVFITYTFTNIASFIDACIKTARSEREVFYSDLTAQFTRDNYLRHTLTAEALNAFNAIICSCTKKFFITLDGFDTTFDLFRRRSILEHTRQDLTSRAVFETEWLSALLMLVNSIRQGKKYTNRFYDLAEFCITVPRDRFLEVTRVDRDSYRYHSRYWTLNWSGIELAILLRKRLEELCQSTGDRRYNAEERLELLWRQHFSSVPWELPVPHSDRVVTMPLFFYVLRHTFWRPREVLLYYAKILAAAKDFKKRRIEVTPEMVRRLVRDTTYEVIASEVINEFSSTVLNIHDLINAFRGKSQFLSFDDVFAILSRVEVRLAVGDTHPRDKGAESLETLEFLYRIGFLGIEADRTLREKYQIWHEHAFFFNEGPTLFRGDHSGDVRKCRYIIHPIFSEYLELATEGQPLVLQFDWTYLHEIDAIISSSGSEGLDGS